MRYIKLNDKKQPTHSLDVCFTKEQVEKEANVGMLVDEPYIVVDIDDLEQFEAVYDIILSKKIKTRIMKSSRGGHFWFKNIKPMTNVVHHKTPLTIDIDIRSYGKKSYVVVKKDGKWREWPIYSEEVDTYPKFLIPLKTKQSLFRYKNHDGRNTGLFALIIPLVKAGFDKDEVKDTFYLINDFIFDDPIEPYEIEKMLEDNDVFTEMSHMFLEKNKFNHDGFARWLVKTYFIRYHAGNLYIYANGVYKRDERGIEKLMIEQIPELTQRHRRETMSYLHLLDIDVSYPDKYSFATLNGWFNLHDGIFNDHSPLQFFTNMVNAKYNPEAYDEHIDNVLNRLVKDSKSLRMIIEEMLGYILMPHVEYQKAFILLGPPGTGKTTFINTITEMIGRENISSLKLEDLNHRFRAVEIIDKMANLGDDISDKMVDDSASFKSFVTGDSTTFEFKGRDAFKYTPSAKLIFTSNHMPIFKDRTGAIEDRLIIVPFTNNFRHSSARDVSIIDNLTTENAKSYLLNLAISGAQRLIRNKRFTESKEVIALIQAFSVDNDNTLQWLETIDSNIDILNRPTKEVYMSYKMYCASSNNIPRSIRNFNNSIKEHLNLDIKRTSIDGKTIQVWRKKD